MATKTTKKVNNSNVTDIFSLVKTIPTATRGGRGPSQYDKYQGRKKFFEAVAYDKLVLSGEVRQAILSLPHAKNFHLPHYDKELVIIEIVPSKEAGGEKMTICLNMTNGEVKKYVSIMAAKRETENEHFKKMEKEEVETA